ncbi:ASKHA domain-containing protein [Dehalococcoidia bacterium]|nr:ASKHA domain-containing protein [Dehalococcoidia bacterium]
MNVLPDDLWLEVNRGQTVWEALQNEDVELEGDCGGLGKCGKCKVRILSSTGPPSQESVELLDEDELKGGIHLACCTEVNEDTVVYLGESDPGLEYFQILKTGRRPPFHLNPLVDQRPVTLLSSHRDVGFSDLDRIKLAMGPDYEDMKSSLHCLRTLPQMLQETQSRGAAVLHENCLMAWQNWAEVGRRYGLVFDLGTSTLVGKLISLTDGSEVAVISRLNSQMKYGSNVISRLQFVKEHSNGLDYLHDLLVRDMNLIIKRLLQVGGLDPNDIFVAVAAGNTTMQHLFLRLNPLGIAEAPFAPVLTDGLIVKATDVGLRLHPEALLYMMPVKSGYIGGDLISVMLASGVAEQGNEIILGLDLGTNGEIFLGNARRLLTCSAAAGPALEGARISRGMIAKAGAIEGVGFEAGHMGYQIIGNIRPKGICGSGLVDLVAALLHYDLVDHEGLIRPPRGRTAEGLSSRIIERSGAYSFLVASPEESYDGKPIYLTQKDVRELQLAKAAIAAGIKTLMDELGIATEDIQRVHLAGALGNYTSPYSAMRIGLIPMLDLKIVASLGNAATTGASMVLLSRDYWQMANDLVDFVEHVELSSHLNFNEYFIQQMDFPREEPLDVHREDVANVMRGIRVDEVMTPDFPTVSSTMSVEKVSSLLRSTGRHGFPVLDENGLLYGVVTVVDLEEPLLSGNAHLPVGDVATKEPFVVHPDHTLYEVLSTIPGDYGRIPVVDRDDRGRLVGVLRRHEIAGAYRERLAQIGKAAKYG